MSQKDMETAFPCGSLYLAVGNLKFMYLNLYVGESAQMGVHMKKCRKPLSLILLFLFMVCLAGCKKATNHSRILVAAIDDQKVYLDKAMYYIWQMEQECNSYEALYQQQGLEDFWNSDAGENQTMRDVVKDDVMENIVRNHILYSQAGKEGYALSKEEEKECRAKAREQLAAMDAQTLEVTGLSEKVLTQINKEELIISRYYRHMVDSFQLDMNQLTADVKEEDFRQYDIETLSIYKDECAKEGQKATREEEKKAYDMLLELLPEAKEAPTLGTLVEDDQSPFIYEELGFIYGQGQYDQLLEDEAIELGNGETSKIIETNDSYVVIRMVNRDSRESYEEALKDARTNGEYQAFDDYYESIKNQYSVTVNQEVWDGIIMGQVTIKEKENGGNESE